MDIFDTHAHIGLIHSDKLNRMLSVATAKTKGLKHILSITNTLGEAEEIYNDLITVKEVVFAVGISPCDIINAPIDWADKIENYVKTKERVVAIGETGLDFQKGGAQKSSQIDFFYRHIDLANKLGLPLVIHNRDAGNDLLKIISEKALNNRAVLHCYSENWTWAKKALDLPVMFSFAGNLTYKTSHDLHECARNLPLERIMIESESPFLVPSAYSGRRNKPSYIVETLNALATIRNLPVEDVAQKVYENSIEFFKLQD